MTRAAILSLALLAGVPSLAAAQAGSVEIGGAVVWTSGYEAGDRSALETRNGTTAGPTLTLFTTESRMRPAVGGEARLGIYLSPRIAVEGHVRVSRPVLETRLDDDYENADAATAEQKVSSYLFGGTLLYHLGTGAFVPFVSAGGSYQRELHEDNAVVLTGAEFHAGGGIKYWFGSRGRRFGLRFDAQASSRNKSIAFEEKRRLLGIFAAGASYRF